MEYLLSADQGPVAAAFLVEGVSDFSAAMDWTHRLAYGRNSDKSDLLCVFRDRCATCSTKHALIKQLAEEIERADVRLFIGIYLMQARNTAKVADVLAQYGLACLPEAHCYLKINESIVDLTHPGLPVADHVADLQEEISIEAHQIGAFKIAYHQSALQKWLQENTSIPYSPEEIWSIREACIAALSE
jgi:hypothetical protein